MENKAYDFDPDAIKGAEKFFVKNTIPQINKLEPNTIPNFAKANNVSIEEAEKLFAQKTMADLKKSLIESNRDPESLFRLIAGTFKIKDKSSLLDTAKETVKKGKEVSVLTSEGKLIQAGGDLQTVMKKVLGQQWCKTWLRINTPQSHLFNGDIGPKLPMIGVFRNLFHFCYVVDKGHWRYVAHILIYP